MCMHACMCVHVCDVEVWAEGARMARVKNFCVKVLSNEPWNSLA